MPKKSRQGFTAVTLEFPDALLDAARKKATEDGQKLAPWVFAAVAKKAGTKYVPPKLGRPKNGESVSNS